MKKVNPALLSIALLVTALGAGLYLTLSQSPLDLRSSASTTLPNNDGVHLILESDETFYEDSAAIVTNVVIDAGTDRVNGVKTCLDYTNVSYEDFVLSSGFPNQLQLDEQPNRLCVTVGVNPGGEVTGKQIAFGVTFIGDDAGKIAQISFDESETFVTSSDGNPISNITGQIVGKHIGIAHKGDCDLDGEVSLADFGYIVANYGMVDTSGALLCDSDHDNEIGLTDFSSVVANFGRILEVAAQNLPPSRSTCPAACDFNGNGVYGDVDQRMMKSCLFGGPSAAICSGIDINADGTTNSQDVTALNQCYSDIASHELCATFDFDNSGDVSIAESRFIPARIDMCEGVDFATACTNSDPNNSGGLEAGDAVYCGIHCLEDIGSTYELQLHEGANLISMPVNMENTHIDLLLEDLLLNNNLNVSVFGYQATANGGRWLSFHSEIPFFRTITHFEPGRGYFIMIDKKEDPGSDLSVSVNLAGSVPEDNFLLDLSPADYHLVGITALKPVSIRSIYPESQYPDMQVWRIIEPRSDSEELVYEEFGPEQQDFTTFDPGVGYWIILDPAEPLNFTGPPGEDGLGTPPQATPTIDPGD